MRHVRGQRPSAELVYIRPLGKGFREVRGNCNDRMKDGVATVMLVREHAVAMLSIRSARVGVSK